MDKLLSFSSVGLTQEQINYIPAALSQMLAMAKITHDGVSGTGCEYSVLNPSSDFTFTLEEVLAMEAFEIAQDQAG